MHVWDRLKEQVNSLLSRPSQDKKILKTEFQFPLAEAGFDLGFVTRLVHPSYITYIHEPSCIRILKLISSQTRSFSPVSIFRIRTLKDQFNHLVAFSPLNFPSG